MYKILPILICHQTLPFMKRWTTYLHTSSLSAGILQFLQHNLIFNIALYPKVFS